MSDKSKSSESEIKHDEEYGVIVILDALGVKGIWKNRKPEDVLREWEITIDVLAEDIVELKNQGMSFNYNAFSDTLILSLTDGEIEKMIQQMSVTVGTFVSFGIVFGINFRGCISIGKFYQSKRMIIGPAIDEAAMYYQDANWIGVHATPSVYSRIRRDPTNVRFYKFIEYKIPFKQRTVSSFAVKLVTDIEPLKKENFTKHDSLIELIHEKLEHTDDPVGSEKWKNTLDFLYHVKNFRKQ